jgi:hypothetical protein
MRIARDVQHHDSYFTQKKDATGRLGLHPLQKLTAANRMLAYGTAADAVRPSILVSLRRLTLVYSSKMSTAGPQRLRL